MQMHSEDPYVVLGVDKSASADEIKRAYRKLTRQLHPDVNPGDRDAEERFKRVTAAYEVVGDPEKRRRYDEYGEAGLQADFNPERARAYQRWRRRAKAGESFYRHGQDATDPFGGDPFDLSDLFGGGDDFVSTQPGDRDGADIETEMEVSLADAVLGTHREVAFSRPTRCSACQGCGVHPSAKDQPCSACDGLGTRRIAQGPIEFRTNCGACGGSGRGRGPVCESCGGSGHRPGTACLEIKVPAGISDGQSIRLVGQGMPGVGHGRPGDLRIRIRVATHPRLRREGPDLYLDVPVTIGEAMAGAKIEVPTLTGTVTVSVPPGSQPGAKLRLRGKGVPATDRRGAGDLYLVLRVQVPPVNDVEAAKRLAQQIDELYDANPRTGLRL